MKIFLVNSSKTWGGGEKWHFETACFLKTNNHQVTLLAQAGKDLYKTSVDAGIRTLPVSISNTSFLNPFCLLSLIRLFRKENPDVIIMNVSADIKSAGVAAKLSRIKNIVYRRGSAIPIRNTFINRLLYKNILTFIIANSEETKRTILQNNGNLFPRDKISVIYNGIDLACLDESPVTSLYQKEKEEILIGNAGRLVPQKGQKHLIEMAVLLKKENINFKILIAGNGPLEETLKQQARKEGVDDRIIFLGFVRDIKSFMNTIDIFVLPSLWEGFGYVLVEAMACKRPIVAFHTSSNPEIVDNNKTGYLIKREDIPAFVMKTKFLCHHPEVRESFGHSGRERVENLFEIKKTQQKVANLLCELTKTSF